ncbi:MAG: hypothetical protein HQL99_05150 [Magnetococcales bacterium]|nr:hypothetical protein [Magnetococcales bacterium]
MSLSEVLTRLRALPDDCPERVFADTLELDLPSLSSRHPWANRHGNNVQPDLEALFVSGLGGVLAHGDDETFLKALHATTVRLEGAVRPHFLCAGNAPNRCPVQEHRLTRYVRVPFFYQQWMDPAQASPTPDPATMGRMVRRHLARLGRITAPSLEKSWIAWPMDVTGGHLPSGAWVVRAADAPHRRGEMAILSEDEKVRKVVEWLALPGFSTPEQRREHIGLIAIDFVSSTPLYKPTVLDALNSVFFWPGPTTGCHGLTQPLESDLVSPDNRRRGLGVSEQLCEPLEVPVWDASGQLMVELVGFFAD